MPSERPGRLWHLAMGQYPGAGARDLVLARLAPSLARLARWRQACRSDTCQVIADWHAAGVAGGLRHSLSTAWPSTWPRAPVDRAAVRYALERALDLALPPSCAGCGVEGELFCVGCRPALEARLERPGGVAIGLVAEIPAVLLQLEWCSPFSGPVRAALHALKYAGERRLAEPLGRALATRWRHAGAGGDLIVPVPIHAGRARERGYDQAVLLAEVAARGLNLPCGLILERHRPTERQFDLDRRARAGNVAGAFPAGGRGAGESPARGSLDRARRRRRDHRFDLDRLRGHAS
jgi:predicted amidophosphoribosyltransferase